MIEYLALIHVSLINGCLTAVAMAGVLYVLDDAMPQNGFNCVPTKAQVREIERE